MRQHGLGHLQQPDDIGVELSPDAVDGERLERPLAAIDRA
jgi:hypothetical protein